MNRKKQNLEAINQQLDFHRQKEIDLKKFENEKNNRKTSKLDILNDLSIVQNIQSNLYENKKLLIGEYNDIDLEGRRRYNKRKKIEENIEIFDSVMKAAQNPIDKKLTKVRIKDLNTIIETFSKENKNMTKNFIKKFNELTPDTDSVLDSMNTSMNNLMNMEDELAHFVIDKRNQNGTKLKQMFSKNILLAKQVSVTFLHRIIIC
jgi:hypothetical protein